MLNTLPSLSHYLTNQRIQQKDIFQKRDAEKHLKAGNITLQNSRRMQTGDILEGKCTQRM